MSLQVRAASPTRERLVQPCLDIVIGEARIDRMARQRSKVAIRPPERLAAQGVLTDQAGSQQDRIIRVDRYDDAGTAQSVDRVIMDGRVDAQLQIGCRADAERNLPIDQQSDQFGVFDRAHAMIDASFANDDDKQRWKAELDAVFAAAA